MLGLSDFLVALLLIPILVVMIDGLGQARALRNEKHCHEITATTMPCADFTLIVPVWGNIAYLENVEYLRQYGNRVLLTTSAAETPEFYDGFYDIAAANGFRTFVSPRPEFSTDGTARRQIGGTLRDTIVRNAHGVITSRYVVCIDADTVTDVPIDYLVGRFEESGLDIASVRLVAANRNTLLARLQGHEYRMAMHLRRIMPWMVSGACHVAKREVHRDLMRRHSLFFQGNDVELGLLAKARKYRIGHIPFVVPTEVPSTVHGWWRQRKAWSGGEFRLMIVNIRMGWRHPFLFLYGAIIVFALLPTRYYYVTHPSFAVLSVLVLYYLLLLLVNWRTRDRALFAYPFYSLMYTMVIIPFGIATYIHMAYKHRNLGVIKPNRRVPVGEPKPARSSLASAAGSRGRHRVVSTATGLQQSGGAVVSVALPVTPPAMQPVPVAPPVFAPATRVAPVALPVSPPVHPRGPAAVSARTYIDQPMRRGTGSAVMSLEAIASAVSSVYPRNDPSAVFFISLMNSLRETEREKRKTKLVASTLCAALIVDGATSVSGRELALA